MTRDIDNTQDIIDSRDVIARIEELEAEQEALLDDEREADGEWEAYYGQELAALKALADEAEGSPDWRHGEVLIRYSYFEDYARQLAEDVGAISDDAQWPCNCIDWEQAANELRMDYFSVDFDGVDYWIRS